MIAPRPVPVRLKLIRLMPMPRKRRLPFVFWAGVAVVMAVVTMVLMWRRSQ